MNNQENYNDNYNIIDIYNNLEVGDIIWAKRYTNEEQMNQIPEGHQEGPYVVIGKDEEGIKCLYGTSTPPKKEFLYYRILVLNNLSYYLPKTSYIKIAKHSYIPQDRFIKRLGHLNNEDKKMLFKKIDIAYRDGIYYDMDIDTPNIPLEAGDIISNGHEYYLIIEETKNKYECIKLLEEQNGLNFFITIDGKKYYLNLDNTKSYSKSLEPIRENFIDNQTLLNIQAMKKQRQNYLLHKDEISRGSLIRKNNTLYYIYGEINNLWMAFEIIGQPNNNLCNIIINNKNYYTDFNNTIEIPKTEKNIEIITTANEKEMAKIKEQKKSYIKTKKQEKEKQKQKQKQPVLKPEIQCGSLIKFKNVETNYLDLVIIREQNEVVSIRYDKFLEGQYFLHKFNINQIEFVNKVENFNLLEILYNIKDKTKGFINKAKLTEMINILKENKVEPLTKKLTLSN